MSGSETINRNSIEYWYIKVKHLAGEIPMPKLRPRSEIVSEEITSNPIFLLQRRRVVPNMECPAEYDSDREIIVHPDTKEELDDDKLLDLGWGTITWLTEKVFVTREEGEEYGEAHKYNCGKGRKGTDWNVYCIPCEGELAQILNIRPEILEFALGMERKKIEREHTLFRRAKDKILIAFRKFSIFIVRKIIYDDSEVTRIYKGL